MKEIRDKIVKVLGVGVFQQTETREFGGDKTAHGTGRGKEMFHKDPMLPPELEEPFSSVQAAITARLKIEGTAGGYPHDYGDMGGADVPLNELNRLSENFSDEDLVSLYLKRSGNEQAKNDSDYRNPILMAIGSIRGATPIRKK
jgi:hypothetical protein